jgi:hypothetical protein
MKMRSDILLLFLATMSLNVAAATETDCIGTLCFSENGGPPAKKINSLFSPQVLQVASNEDGSYCFFDPRQRVSWSLHTFDLHEEKKGAEKIEYVLSASVSATQHCKRFAEHTYPWRSFQTQRGIRLGATLSEVSAKYGTSARRILAEEPRARTYVAEIVGGAVFKEIWIFRGEASASLFFTIFVFDMDGKVIGFGVGNGRG